jgi:hypothetical protein
MLIMGGGPSFFQKAELQKIASILVLEVIKSKSEIRSFMHLAESEITGSKSNQRNSSGISIPPFKFDPGNREGSHGGSVK